MKLSEILTAVNGKNLTPSINPENIDITGGYSCDLLSDVMGNALENQIWVTIMRHLNVIAVASLSGIPAVVFTKDIVPEEAVIKKAIEENICLITTELNTFETNGKIYNLF